MAKIFGRRIYFSLFIAAIGLAGGILFTFTLGNPPPPPPNQLSLPPSTPYEHAVSGTGLVEANSRNVDLGVFVSGIVDTLNVNEGDAVKKGDVLMTIDTRSAIADLHQREKDIATAKAAIQTAQATLEDEQDQLARAMGLKAGVSVSVDFQKRHQYATQRAQAQLAQAKAQYESAKAAYDAAKVMLDKHTITSPIDGQVLKVRVRAGESVTAGQTVPVTVGNTTPLNLRVQIDENDLWRFDEKAHAVAFLRSNKERKYDLTFVRTEPYVLPKKQLSGDTTEQVDTRIMEVVYAITPQEDAPLYVGQQLDVFIEGATTSSTPQGQ